MANESTAGIPATTVPQVQQPKPQQTQTGQDAGKPPAGGLPWQTGRQFDYRVDQGTGYDWSTYRPTDPGTEQPKPPGTTPKPPETPPTSGDPRGRSTKPPKPRQTFSFRMPTPTDPSEDIQDRWAAAEGMRPDIDEANIDRLNHYDRQYLTDLATQQIETARQQYNQQVDRAMDTQAAGLNRALADAQGQFRNQQNQVAANERQAMDNAALYAQARGDQGGIGLAQYNSIQNNAAKNKLAVSQAQTKLATDTARQISDLRAQGEFDKADKMLGLTQTYLSELRAIEEYAANYNLSVDQLNTSIAKWENEFNRATAQYMASWEQSMMQYTGGFSDGTTTYQAEQQTQQAQAQLALSLIQSGINPDRLSPAQLAALQQQYGMTRSEIIALYRQAKKNKKKK